MTIQEATLLFTMFNSIAVPLLVSAWNWRKSVDKRLARMERKLDLDPITHH